MNKRIEYIDLAKGLAIYLVVLGHALGSLAAPTMEHGIIGNVIYSFHMPLFMILSGFFAVLEICYYLSRTFKKIDFINKLLFGIKL